MTQLIRHAQPYKYKCRLALTSYHCEDIDCITIVHFLPARLILEVLRCWDHHRRLATGYIDLPRSSFVKKRGVAGLEEYGGGGERLRALMGCSPRMAGELSIMWYGGGRV